MISCLCCFSRFNNVSALKHVSQGIFLKNSRVLLLKNYCNNIDATLKVSADDTTNAFSEIYRFPGIRLGFYLQKMRWHQSVLAAIAVPSSLVLYYCGLIDSDLMIGVIVPSVMLTLHLYVVSSLFHNTVGFLYLSKDETTLKVSYLDFSGKRIDKEFPLDDVVPFLDAPRPPTDRFYKQLVFYSSNTSKLKLFLKLGQITDKDKFDKVFGPLELNK